MAGLALASRAQMHAVLWKACDDPTDNTWEDVGSFLRCRHLEVKCHESRGLWQRTNNATSDHVLSVDSRILSIAPHVRGKAGRC